MMSDKELLELAAKAAGIDGKPVAHFGQLMGIVKGKMMSHEGDEFWTPLTDDGDALRLAVKLHINIEIWNVDDLVRANVYLKGRGHGDFEERYTTDPYAATRRAIVRAAAEIGKEKK